MFPNIKILASQKCYYIFSFHWFKAIFIQVYVYEGKINYAMAIIKTVDETNFWSLLIVLLSGIFNYTYQLQTVG